MSIWLLSEGDRSDNDSRDGFTFKCLNVSFKKILDSALAVVELSLCQENESD